MQGKIETSGDAVPIRIKTTWPDGRINEVELEASCIEDATWFCSAMGVDEVITGHRQLTSDDVKGWWNRQESPGNSAGQQPVATQAPKLPEARPAASPSSSTPRTPSSGKGGSKVSRVLEAIRAAGTEGIRYTDLVAEFGPEIAAIPSQLKKQGLIETVERGRYRGNTGGGRR